MVRYSAAFFAACSFQSAFQGVDAVGGVLRGEAVELELVDQAAAGERHEVEVVRSLLTRIALGDRLASMRSRSTSRSRSRRSRRRRRRSPLELTRVAGPTPDGILDPRRDGVGPGRAVVVPEHLRARLGLVVGGVAATIAVLDAPAHERGRRGVEVVAEVSSERIGPTVLRRRTRDVDRRGRAGRWRWGCCSFHRLRRRRHRGR